MQAILVSFQQSLHGALARAFWRFQLFTDWVSGVSEEMFDDGFQNITNIDISFTVIKQMQELYKEKYPTLQYKQGDVRQL